MFTSHYGNLGALAPPFAPVAISRGLPRWKGGWRARLAAGIVGRTDMRLAPSWASLKADDPGYDRAFAAQLRALDPARVYAELGEDAVLLCHCAPGVFCHRRLVAEWFEHHLGVIVAELGIDRLDTPMCMNPAYDFYLDLDAKYDLLEDRLGRPRDSSR